MSGPTSSARPKRLPSNLPEWTFLPLCLFLYVIATNTQSGWLYVLLAFLAGVLLTGFIGARLAVRGLAVRRDIVGDAVAGESVLVRLSVTNLSRRARHYLMLRDIAPLGLQSGPPAERRLGLDRLDPGTTGSVDYLLRCPRRGIFPISTTVVVSGAPVGLYAAARVYPAAGIVTVLPSGPHLARVPIHTAVPSTVVPHHANNVLGQSHDFAGIREYVPGEDVRFIHWPSTARTGELMIKEFMDVSSQHVVILIDGHTRGRTPAGTEPVFEAMVAAAVSLTEASHRHNMALTLITTRGGAVDIVRHPRGRQPLYILAGLEPDSDLTAEALFRLAAGGIAARSQVFVLTARSSLRPAAMAELSGKRVHVSVFLFRPPGQPSPDPYETAAEAWREARVGVYLVDDVTQLPLILEAAHG